MEEEKRKRIPPTVHISQTGCYGGNGGAAFNWYKQSPTLTARSFIIRSGALIDNIQVVLKDSNSTLQSPKYGGYGGS